MKDSQGDLFVRPPAPPAIFAEPKKLEAPPVGPGTFLRNHRKDCAKWIGDHPEECDLLLKWARQIMAKNRPFGIALLWEKLRWEYISNDRETPKLNNNWRAYFSRWLIAQEPKLEGLLECRAVAF